MRGPRASPGKLVPRRQLVEIQSISEFVLDGMILKHEAHRWSAASAAKENAR
jgi:hypothetical protein